MDDLLKAADRERKLKGDNAILRKENYKLMNSQDGKLKEQIKNVYLSALKNGTWVVKHCKLNGHLCSHHANKLSTNQTVLGSCNKYHEVYLWLSTNRQYICWDSSGRKNTKKTKRLLVSSIRRLIVGHWTRVSQKSLTHDQRVRSFALDSTVRLLAFFTNDEHAYNLWVNGLQKALLPEGKSTVVPATNL